MRRGPGRSGSERSATRTGSSNSSRTSLAPVFLALAACSHAAAAGPAVETATAVEVAPADAGDGDCIQRGLHASCGAWAVRHWKAMRDAVTARFGDALRCEGELASERAGRAEDAAALGAELAAERARRRADIAEADRREAELGAAIAPASIPWWSIPVAVAAGVVLGGAAWEGLRSQQDTPPRDRPGPP